MTLRPLADFVQATAARNFVLDTASYLIVPGEAPIAEGDEYLSISWGELNLKWKKIAG